MPAPTSTPPAPPADGAAPPAAPASQPPDFDIVRIGPRGQAVIAGRAAPGAEVEVEDGGASLGRTRADARGEWVLVPEQPLPPGGRELTLTARGPDGGQVRGDASVVLVVPERPEAPSGQPPAPPGALAVLTPAADAAPRVLQAPAAPARPLPRGGLGLEIVDYAAGGEVRFTGTASPTAAIRLYVDNAPVGDARAGADGRWTLVPASAIAPGAHTLRIDQISPQGTVIARLELPFQRADLATGTLPDGKVVVQPGQSLWRIARAHYGRGIQYIVIYEANRDAIRDPDLIYPGQIFDLPGPVH